MVYFSLVNNICPISKSSFGLYEISLADWLILTPISMSALILEELRKKIIFKKEFQIFYKMIVAVII